MQILLNWSMSISVGRCHVAMLLFDVLSLSFNASIIIIVFIAPSITYFVCYANFCTNYSTDTVGKKKKKKEIGRSNHRFFYPIIDRNYSLENFIQVIHYII